MEIINKIKDEFNRIPITLSLVIIIVILVIYILTSKNTIENFTETSAPTTSQLGISQENLRAIDNLAEIAKSMTDGNGNLKIPGNLTVSGNINGSGKLDINGNIRSSGNIEANGFGQFGVAKIGNHKDATNMAEFSHKERWGHNYTLLSDRTGHTYINSKSGTRVNIRSNNNDALGELSVDKINVNKLNLTGWHAIKKNHDYFNTNGLIAYGKPDEENNKAPTRSNVWLTSHGDRNKGSYQWKMQPYP